MGIDEVIEAELDRLRVIPNELAPLKKQYEKLEARIDREIDWESMWEIGWENLDPEQQDYISELENQSYELTDRINELEEESSRLEYAIANQIENKFVIENYREWYKNPEEIRSHLEPNRGYTLLSMYLDRYYSQKDREMILGQLMSGYWSETGKDSSELLPIFDVMTNFPDDDEGLYQNMLWSMGFFDLGYPYWYAHRPAVRAMYYGDDRSVFAIIPSGSKTDRSKVIRWGNTLGESSEIFVSDINEYIIQRMEIDYLTSCRFAFISESDFEDLDIVSNYLDALHVKAIIRAELPEYDINMFKDYTNPNASLWTKSLIGYDGTEEWPYESFKIDFDSVKSNWYLLNQFNEGMKYQVENGEITLEDSRYVKEPLKDTFRLPIMTTYLGIITQESETEIRIIIYSDDGLFEGEGAINKLLDLPTPKSMIDSHYRDVDLAIKEKDRQIALAYEKLNLPDLPEGVCVQPETEAPTEAPTKETVAPSTETATEATMESTEEELAEESTAAVADETETFASKDTKDPSDKGILILLISIVAGVVLAGAAIAVVVVKKKSKAKE